MNGENHGALLESRRVKGKLRVPVRGMEKCMREQIERELGEKGRRIIRDEQNAEGAQR